MSLNLRLNKIINFLKTSSKNKHVVVKYKKNKLILGILEILLKEKIILNFYLENDYYHIFLKYNELGESIIKDLKIYYKRPFELNFSVKQLKSKQFLKNYFSQSSELSSFYIFSTSKGILTYKQCLEFNEGGLMLLQVKFL